MKRLFIIIITLMFASCYLRKQPEIGHTPINYEQVYHNTVIDNVPHQGNNGSLFQDNSIYNNMGVEHKARNVNDIVTVIITENTSASNRATTTSQKDSSYDMGVSNIFGLENRNLGFNPSSSLGTSAGNSFTGSGETTREGQIRATITARVIQKFPNGNLLIQGSREIVINNERQIIYISGLIRPIDISRDNIITSTKISDMQLSYYGKGLISENQRPGFLGRFINYIWPF